MLCSLPRSPLVMLLCYVKIYTDWANHYLEKVNSKCFIVDLQFDLSSGVLLAELVSAVCKLMMFLKAKPRRRIAYCSDNGVRLSVCKRCALCTTTQDRALVRIEVESECGGKDFDCQPPT